ncbi:MAG: 30S ribosomal protein S6 [Sphaerochaetaceae bacterium]|nr:30S ribosomal protein S6 [Sphaerochaetaceae bacterium]
MRNYELTVIFEANEETTAKGLELVEKELATGQVEITKHDDMGVRNLAYPIKKQDKGHYHYFEIAAEPASINAFSNAFRLMQPVYKFLFVLKDN